MGKNRRKGKKNRKRERTPNAEYFLIASEGAKTEKNYFNHFKTKLIEEKHFADDKIELPYFQIEGVGMIGEALINEAENYFRRNPVQYKYKWIVFDKDNFSPVEFNRLIDIAKGKGFQVAWSNESFELWLILHFEFLNTGLTRDKYLEKLDSLLKEHGLEKGYEKNDMEVFEHTYHLTNVALRNAQKLREKHKDLGLYTPSDQNPCTEVDLLIDELLALGT